MSLVVTYLRRHLLILGLHRNSAKSAMWSDDHSGEGRAVSFLKLSSSKSSNKDSTDNESAEVRKHNQLIIKASCHHQTKPLTERFFKNSRGTKTTNIGYRYHGSGTNLCKICNRRFQWNPLCNLWKVVHLFLGPSSILEGRQPSLLRTYWGQ